MAGIITHVVSSNSVKRIRTKHETSEAGGLIFSFILSQIQINNKQQHSVSSVSSWDKEERRAQQTALASKYKREKETEVTAVGQPDVGGITPKNSQVRKG